MAIQIVMDRTGDSRNTASTRTTGKNSRRRSRASPPPSGPVRVRCPESDRSTRTRKRRLAERRKHVSVRQQGEPEPALEVLGAASGGSVPR